MVTFWFDDMKAYDISFDPWKVTGEAIFRAGSDVNQDKLNGNLRFNFLI